MRFESEVRIVDMRGRFAVDPGGELIVVYLCAGREMGMAARQVEAHAERSRQSVCLHLSERVAARRIGLSSFRFKPEFASVGAAAGS